MKYQQEIYEIRECMMTPYSIEDLRKAIEAGKRSVEKYPENPVAYLCLGIAYFNVGELKRAYEAIEKAESLVNNKKEDNKMGNLNDIPSYLAKDLAKYLDNIDMQATILNRIATMYYHRGELDKALRYCEESLNLCIEVRKITTYNNIALIYDKKGDYQEAVKYFKKAIKIGEEYMDYYNISMDYYNISMVKLNLGDTCRKMKDYENAEKYLSEGLEGVKKIGNKYWEAMGYLNFGELYKNKGDEKTAKEYFTRAYNLFKSIGAEGYAQGVLNSIKESDKSK